ncbi:MAG: DUF4258 domain-containing protein [Parcubacteria group bacterium]|nr:DUF4258 domain-containing protein [Parcubacteria group bacterium]
MLKIVFTKHALEKLQQRNIPKNLVAKTVFLPQKIVAAPDKFHAFRKFGKKYLKVVFAKSENNIVVITQYFIDSMP